MCNTALYHESFLGVPLCSGQCIPSSTHDGFYKQPVFIACLGVAHGLEIGTNFVLNFWQTDSSG
jgi:hypothetical protein